MCSFRRTNTSQEEKRRSGRSSTGIDTGIQLQPESHLSTHCRSHTLAHCRPGPLSSGRVSLVKPAPPRPPPS